MKPSVYIESTVISYIEAINDDKGYVTPIICTPEELMEA